MKFIVKTKDTGKLTRYYLAPGEGYTLHRNKAHVYDSAEVAANKRINIKLWLDKDLVRVIPVGGL